MYIESHAVFSTAVFGTSTAGYLGSLLPDTFTTIKWMSHPREFLLDLKSFVFKSKSYHHKEIGGKLNELSRYAHSITITIPLIVLGIYGVMHGLPQLLIFSMAWTLHLISDCLTHKRRIFPLYPFNKKWEFPYSIDIYKPKNFYVVVLTDIVLITVLVLKYRLIGVM